MVVSIEHHSFINFNPTIILKVQQVYKLISEILKSFDGAIVSQNEDGFLISFRAVTKAVLCALKIQEKFKILRIQYQIKFTELSIGLHAGVPVTEKKSIFEDTIKKEMFLM